MSRQACPYCGHQNTISVYWAELPKILSACPEAILPQATLAPFEVRLCQNCSLGFNSQPLSLEDLTFLYDNYLYISPLKGMGTQKYTGMVKTLKKECAPGDHLVEIGCSEGYLLQQLADGGFTNLLGIEPGPQAATARALGHRIHQEYFDDLTCRDERVDCFYLMHVFEHFPDPFTILAQMVDQLSVGGKIIIEVPNACGFHHQHLFYYNEIFLEKLARQQGLTPLVSHSTKEIIRVVWQKQTTPPPALSKIPSLDMGSPMRQRCRAVDAMVKRLNAILAARQGKKLHWWGCGSAAVIYISRLDPDRVSGVEWILIDGDKSREGYYLPGLDARVIHPDNLNPDNIDSGPGTPDLCLVIASSFHEEILNAIGNYKISPGESIIIKDFI